MHPIVLPSGDIWPHTVFLKNVIDHPRIEVGDYTYYNDVNDPEDYARTLAPYLHAESPEKLVIGKYVQIAQGVQFVTSSANHQMDGISTYPFAVFGGSWSQAYQANWPFKGDTVVGHDVWIGHEALIMPGVSIGSGAIIGTRSVVTKDVAPYTIVAGNPAHIKKTRFSQTQIDKLLTIAWWNWDTSTVEKNISVIVGHDIAQLEAIDGQS